MRAGDGAVGMRYLVGWRREPSQRRASFVRVLYRRGEQAARTAH